MSHRSTLTVVMVLLTLCVGIIGAADMVQARPTLYWGVSGEAVREVQVRLSQWGYYDGPISGVYGPQTQQAVLWFQRRNGLTADGVVGPQTYAAMGLTPGTGGTAGGTGVARSDELGLLTRIVSAEARGEPYVGQVAVAAVVLNRVQSSSFPNSVSSVIYQPLAFESIMNGTVWRTPAADAERAVRDAMNGWDPTYGSLYFWNPYKQVNPWVWSRTIVTQIGQHVFAR